MKSFLSSFFREPSLTENKLWLYFQKKRVDKEYIFEKNCNGKAEDLSAPRPSDASQNDDLWEDE